MEKTKKERIIFKFQTGIIDDCSKGLERDNWLDYSWGDILQVSPFEGIEQPQKPSQFYVEKESRKIARGAILSGGFF